MIVVCVSDTADVESVLFGPGGVAEGTRAGHPGHRLLDHRPGADPRLRRSAGQGCGHDGRRPGLRWLRRRPEGDPDDLRRWRPGRCRAGPTDPGRLGKTITHVGPIGSGQAVKAVNQVILAGTYLGVAEGIVLAVKAGLDVEQVVEALGGGAAQSWVLANRSGRMLANDYPSGSRSRSTSRTCGSGSAWPTSSGRTCRSPDCAPRSRRRWSTRGTPTTMSPRSPAPSAAGRACPTEGSGRSVSQARVSDGVPSRSSGSPSLPE